MDLHPRPSGSPCSPPPFSRHRPFADASVFEPLARSAIHLRDGAILKFRPRAAERIYLTAWSMAEPIFLTAAAVNGPRASVNEIASVFPPCGGEFVTRTDFDDLENDDASFALAYLRSHASLSSILSFERRAFITDSSAFADDRTGVSLPWQFVPSRPIAVTDVAMIASRHETVFSVVSFVYTSCRCVIDIYRYLMVTRTRGGACATG